MRVEYYSTGISIMQDVLHEGYPIGITFLLCACVRACDPAN